MQTLIAIILPDSASGPGRPARPGKLLTLNINHLDLQLSLSLDAILRKTILRLAWSHLALRFVPDCAS